MSGETGEKLVYMANQIATFFSSQKGDCAALKTADHINSFWSPPMRSGLAAHVAETGGADLKPTALEAARLIRVSSPGTVERALAAAGERSVPHEHGDDAG